MSYRLINANAIAIKYPEVNDMPCVFADLHGGLHGQFIEERKNGRWIEDGKWLYMCSSCGKPWAHWWARVVPPNQMCKELRYCPSCGARMDEGSKVE